MSELSDAAILLLILLAGSALGVFMRPFLSERHRSAETTDLIRLVVTMLVTFAALVLGLLTTSVKASFDNVDNDLRSFAINIIQLDRSLRQYGSEADRARAVLRSYTAAAIASTWTTEPKPPGDYYPAEVSPPPSVEFDRKHQPRRHADQARGRSPPARAAGSDAQRLARSSSTSSSG